MRLTRRKFLVSLAALPAMTGLYTWKVEPHWLEFVWRDLPVANLPPALAGKRLVQLSDLHIGPQVEEAWLMECFERTASLEPDFVVHTGDFISYHGPATLAQAEGRRSSPARPSWVLRHSG